MKKSTDFRYNTGATAVLDSVAEMQAGK